MATSLAIEEDFSQWLTSKLNSLNTDENVFGDYITGILTGDETFEEKNEALQGIIGEITQDDIAVHCQEILEKWYSKLGSQSVNEPEKDVNNDEVEDQLVKLFEKNSHATTVQKKYTEDERKLREAILAQYSQTSDQEDGEPEERHEERSGENGLVKNTNVQSVIQAQKEKREKAKIDSQKKKEKDREDRDRQKKEAAEKKEKRKTQKQERKR